MKATKTRAEARTVARKAKGHGDGLAAENRSWAVCDPVRSNGLMRKVPVQSVQ